MRGKQGCKVDEITGAQRSSSTARRLFDEPREAAIALAQLREDLELCMLNKRGPKIARPPEIIAAAKQKDFGVYVAIFCSSRST